MNRIQTNHLPQAAALLLSALLLLSTAGCGSQPSPAAASTAAPTSAPAEASTPAPTEASAPAPTEASAPAQTEAPSAPQDVDGAAVPTDADRALFARLVEANSFSEVMTRHSSKQLEAAYYDREDAEIHRFTDYVDAGQFAEESPSGNGLIITELFHLVAGVRDDGPWLMEVFYDRAEAYQEELADGQAYTSLSVVPEETLTKVVSVNGCWYITTEVSDADWVRTRLESDAENAGIEPVYTYEDGMHLAYSYVFDAETEDLLEIWTSLREADGTEHAYSLDRVTYDLDYDISASLFAPYFEAAELCTFHLVFAPGTPEESTRTYTIPKEGVYWTVEYQGEEYLGDVYTDPACTQVYVGGARPDEVTLYIPAQS